MTPRKVMVAVPTFEWTINTMLASFLMRLCSGALLSPAAFRFEAAFLPETYPIHYARNLLVGAFLESDCDALWFLDDDITPTDTSVRVLEVEADIVTGRAPVSRPGDEGFPVIAHAAFSERLADGSFRYAPRGKEPSDVVAAGAGCLLVYRAVLADPRMRLDPVYDTAVGEPRSLADEPGAAPAIFRMPSKPNGEPLSGEDMDFVYRAHRLGYRCMFHPAAEVGHLKRVDLAGVEVMISRAVAAAKRPPASTP